MARSAARETIKNDLKTIKEDVVTLKDDVKSGAQAEAAALKAKAADKAARAEALVREKAGQASAKARELYGTAREYGGEYYDEASLRLDEAQRYVSERVRERPVQSTAIAVGVGVLIGLLLAGRRD